MTQICRYILRPRRQGGIGIIDTKGQGIGGARFTHGLRQGELLDAEAVGCRLIPNNDVIRLSGEDIFHTAIAKHLEELIEYPVSIVKRLTAEGIGRCRGDLNQLLWVKGRTAIRQVNLVSELES